MHMITVLAYVGRCKYHAVCNIPAACLNVCSNSLNFSVSFRPTETPGLFSFVIAGHKVNHSLLSSDEGALRKCFAENTGSKTSLKFKEIPWVNHYMFVVPLSFPEDVF